LLVLGCTLFFLAPANWDARAWAMLAVGTIVIGVYMGWGWRRLMRWTGILRPAGDRFREIATRSAERAGIELRSIEQAAVPMVNAFAFVHDRGIGVTDAALAVLDDDELGAVCAHELAHLAEPGWVKAIRLSYGFFWGLLVSSLCLLPPMVESLGPQAVLFIFSFGLAGLLVANGAFLRLTYRMEVRADAQAFRAEEAPGADGRALAKMYERNLVPVVMGAKRRTHPELYDRLVAAGLNPDYPRPDAPPRGPWLAGLLALILGSIAGGFVVSDLVARRIPRGVLAPKSAALWTIGAVGGSYDEFSVLTEVDRDGGDEDAE
jgi:Zn-dependent protease with chaperone function